MVIIIIIIIIIIIYLFNVEYNADNYNKNHNIASFFRQNLRQSIFCFDCKVTLRPCAILSYVDYGAAVKLEKTNNDEVL